MQFYHLNGTEIHDGRSSKELIWKLYPCSYGDYCDSKKLSSNCSLKELIFVLVCVRTATTMYKS